jgi:hypothetical protein
MGQQVNFTCQAPKYRAIHTICVTVIEFEQHKAILPCLLVADKHPMLGAIAVSG